VKEKEMSEYSFEEEKQKFLLEIKTWFSFDSLLTKYSIEIRSNKELILLLLQTTRNVVELKYISDELKKDKDIFLLAAEYKVASFNYAHEDLKKDQEFILEIFKKSRYILNYINLELLNDEYFLWYINEIEKLKSNSYLIHSVNKRIFNELRKNPNYLEDFAPPVNYKPAKRN
jgi:hypothetical protein